VAADAAMAAKIAARAANAAARRGGGRAPPPVEAAALPPPCVKIIRGGNIRDYPIFPKPKKIGYAETLTIMETQKNILNYKLDYKDYKKTYLRGLEEMLPLE
jgi:hypothetical protein